MYKYISGKNSNGCYVFRKKTIRNASVFVTTLSAIFHAEFVVGIHVTSKK